jgi:hypothetical protein
MSYSGSLTFFLRHSRHARHTLAGCSVDTVRLFSKTSSFNCDMATQHCSRLSQVLFRTYKNLYYIRVAGPGALTYQYMFNGVELSELQV